MAVQNAENGGGSSLHLPEPGLLTANLGYAEVGLT